MSSSRLRRASLLRVVGPLAFVVAAAAISAQTTVTDVGQFAGTYEWYSVYGFGGVNNSGQVAGYGKDVTYTDEPFRWSLSTSVFEEFVPVIGYAYSGLYSYTEKINNSGVCAGFGAADWSYDEHAAYWDAAGNMNDIGTLGGASARAHGLNDAGVIVGGSDTADGGRDAFTWNGSLTDLGVPGGYVKSEAQDINASGRVVGYATDSAGNRQAYRYEGGTWTSLGSAAGYSYSEATRVNASGKIVGRAYNSDTDSSPFYWDGAMHALGNLGGTSGYANGINTSGAVVGSAKDASDNSRAFLWLGGSLINVNDLLSPADAAVWTFWSATGINDKGWISAWGYNSVVNGGDFHTALIIPGPFVTGHVELDLWTGPIAGLTTTMEFRTPGTTNVIHSYPLTLDANSNYLVPAVDAGTWDIGVKFSNFLREVHPSVVVAAGPTIAAFFQNNGDATDDNKVNLLDLSTILANWATPGPGDLNGDGVVNLLDLSTVLSNYNMVGAS